MIPPNYPKYIDPLAEYGSPVTFLNVVLDQANAAEQVLAEKKRLTMAELEYILEHDVELAIEIAPNGSIVTRPMTNEERGNRKPITMRENLGGEYTVV